VLLVICFHTSWSQPAQETHSYKGVTLSFPKNKNPEELLSWLNNHGYPFAQIELDTLYLDRKPQEFIWNVAMEKYVVLDTVITSQALFNKKILYRCINYQLGQAYSEEKIKASVSALNNISFLKSNAQTSVRFHKESFSLVVKTERKKNNLIAALIALQPRPNSTKSVLTGNIDLELSNALKQAEILELHWKRPQPKSQSFAFKLGSPFTLGLPLGFQFDFNSFLRDSTFSSTDLSLRLITKMNDMNGFSAAVNRSTNTHFQTSALYGNTRNKSYSLRYAKNKNQSNSINFLLEGLAGTRTIQYESSTSQKKIFSAKAQTWSKWNIGRTLFSNVNLELNALFSDSLFNNEIVRLGGTKNLRAFLEESIYASQYAMLNFEFGTSLGADIQTFVFSDVAFIREPITQTNYDTGIGFRFQQDNGSVSLTYGVGNIENNGLQLKNGRVGITFSSRF
jgi:hypothetical protein